MFPRLVWRDLMWTNETNVSSSTNLCPDSKNWTSRGRGLKQHPRHSKYIVCQSSGHNPEENVWYYDTPGHFPSLNTPIPARWKKYPDHNRYLTCSESFPVHPYFYLIKISGDVCTTKRMLNITSVKSRIFL